MKLCECGCGKEVTKEKNRFIVGHSHSKKFKSKLSVKTKFCACGCGIEIIDKGSNKFTNGHNSKTKLYKEVKESKLCKCGCGEYTKPGNVFIHGHSNRKYFKKSQLCKCGCGEYTKPGNKFIYKHSKKTKEEIEKIRNSVKALWDDPNSVYHLDEYQKNRKKFYETKKGIPRSNETKEKLRIKQKENWNDPDHIFNSTKFRETLSNIHTDIWADLNSSYNSKERSNKISEWSSHKYDDPEYCKVYQEGLKATKNKTEIKIENILNNLFIESFRFVGNFTKWINGKNPDFITKSNKIIELFGDYWHGFKFTGMCNLVHSIERKEHYKKSGYACLIIWESELKNIEKLKVKILNFLEQEIY
jgi:G:T-mismatch repair DNA endonuclease (very short patch repair protein)